MTDAKRPDPRLRMGSPPAPPRRIQSSTERDVASEAARRERARSHPLGVPAVPVGEFETDDYTDKYEGDELAAMRAERPMPVRMALIESKQDENRAEHKALVDKVDTLGTSVARIEGKLDALPAMQATVDKLISLVGGNNANAHETKRQGMAGRTKIVLSVLGLIATGLGILGGASIGGCS